VLLQKEEMLKEDIEELFRMEGLANGSGGPTTTTGIMKPMHNPATET
jgi:hypothetical protein